MGADQVAVSVAADYRMSMRRRELADGTIRARSGELRRWLAFVPDWRTASRRDVNAWIDSRTELGPRARYSAISHLSAFYRWAITEELVEHDPTIGVARPRLPIRLPRPVPAGEVDELVEQVDGEIRTAVLLMLDAGLRCCEVAGLRWVDVDLEAGTLYVFGKGARERLVGLPRRLRHHLYLEQDNGSPFVFGRAVTAARMSQLLGGRFHELGHDVSAHRLRHTYATRLYRATSGDLRAVQQALGHASVATTQIYAQIDVEAVLRAAQALD